jgi:hypothetical protein
MTITDTLTLACDVALSDDMQAAIAAAELAMRDESALHGHFSPN